MLRVLEQPHDFLDQYGRISSAFEIRECLRAVQTESGIGGITLQLSAVELPYVKDYDALSGRKPTEWPLRFDAERWWFAAARLQNRPIGAIAAARDTSEVDGSRTRTDETIIWDIRVLPEHRHQGVGRALMLFAENHVRAAGKRSIKVETQSINLAACRLCAAVGYTLQSIDSSAYPEFPKEVQLIWRKELW